MSIGLPRAGRGARPLHRGGEAQDRQHEPCPIILDADAERLAEAQRRCPGITQLRDQPHTLRQSAVAST